MSRQVPTRKKELEDPWEERIQIDAAMSTWYNGTIREAPPETVQKATLCEEDRKVGKHTCSTACVCHQSFHFSNQISGSLLREKQRLSKVWRRWTTGFAVGTLVDDSLCSRVNVTEEGTRASSTWEFPSTPLGGRHVPTTLPVWEKESSV